MSKRLGFLVGLCAFLGAEALAEQRAERRFDGWPEGAPRPQVDCTCRPPGGGKVPVGAEICVRRDGETVTLRCEMRLNNTIWRPVRQGCTPLS